MADSVTLNEESQRRWQEEQLEHKRFEYDLGPDDVVFDIGAYRGEFSEEILRRFGCKIVAIEPTDSIVNSLIYNAALAPGGRVKIINRAASINDKPIRMGGQFYYTSVYGDKSQSFREFPGFDIAAVMREYPEIALCKINIEGGEYDLLKHILAEGLQTRVRDFQIQFHQIEGAPYEEWYDDLISILTQTHYPTFLLPFCWENWRRR